MISNSVITPEPDDNISTFNFRRHINEYISGRNLLAFWLLGLCNNFGYVVMLSAAKDILEKSDETIDTGCIKNTKYIKCSTLSTGAVLLADILPSLLIKLFAPFTLHTIPFTLRHLLILFFQITSYLLVAYSNTIFIGILGVVFASLGAGLGEITYLSLSSHFHNDVISYWSSGTGGAGIFGSLAFAALTDHSMLGLNSKQALLIMLIVPIILAFSYGILLKCPPTTHKIWLRWPSFNELNFNIFRRRRRRMGGFSSTTTTESFASSSGDDDDLQRLLHSGNILEERQTVLRKNAWTKIRMAKPLLRFMIPLALVYFSEYFINQGLLELLVFNCNNSFNLSPMQQYRWYQVFYQTGVFISRSSIKFFPIRSTLLPILAILQIINALLLFFESLNGLTHLPHILLLMLIIFYEGLLGGSAYVNTFSAIHRTVSKANREFCISFATISDSLGIVLAGFSSIYAHNFICKHRW